MGVKPDSETRDAADRWLALIERDDVPGSWETAASAFRSEGDRDVWARALGAVRLALGTLTSRALAVEERVTDLPGAPAGEYVVQQYHAVYDSRRAVTETLTLVREHDGHWRVVGYYVS